MKLKIAFFVAVLLSGLAVHAQIRELWRFEMPNVFPGGADSDSNSWWYGSYVMAAEVGNDGSTVIAGSAYDITGRIGIFVIKLDAHGGLVWKYRTSFDQPETAYADKLLIDQRGDIYLAFRSLVSFGPTYAVTLTKLSGDGVELWRYVEPGVNIDFHSIPECIRLDEAGNVFLLVMPKSRERSVCKIASNGEVLWRNVERSKKLVDNGNTVKNTMVVKADGGVLVAGGYAEGPSFEVHPVVENLDANGETIWESTDHRGEWIQNYSNISIGPRGSICASGGGTIGISTFGPDGGAKRTVDNFGGRIVATNRSGFLLWRYGDEIGFLNAQGKIRWILQPMQYRDVIGIVPDGNAGWMVVGHDTSNPETLKLVHINEHGRQQSVETLANVPYVAGYYFREANSVLRAADGTLRLVGNTIVSNGVSVVVSALSSTAPTVNNSHANPWMSVGTRNTTDRARTGKQ